MAAGRRRARARAISTGRACGTPRRRRSRASICTCARGTPEPGDGRAGPRPRRRAARRSHRRAAAPARGRRRRARRRSTWPDSSKRLAQGDAQALVLCDEDDIVNFHLALAAREAATRVAPRRAPLQPRARRAGRGLLGCRALSASQLSAPAFVEAALHDDYAQRIHVEITSSSCCPGRRAPPCSRSIPPTGCCLAAPRARSA